MQTFVETCVDFGDVHFAIMQLGSEIALREHPAYGQHMTLYNAQLLGCKALTAYNTCES